MSEEKPCLLLDTSVFVQAYRTYYAYNLCPGFWRSMAFMHKQGKIISLDKVKQELYDGNERDDLIEWAEQNDCFAPSEDEETVYWYAQMQRWVQNHPQFLPYAKNAFASDPDAWILAYAKAKNLTLVTQETYAGDIKKRVKIPNVCEAREFRINYMSTFDMLTELKVQFEWKEKEI